MQRLEYASPTEIEQHQVGRLRNLLNFLQQESVNAFYQEKLAGINPANLQSLADLPSLPLTLKAELVSQQSHYPPYGQNLSYAPECYTKLHQTSGTTGHPLKILDTAESWDWWARCWVEVFRAAGVTEKDRVFVAFSFGLFIGFWTAYEGAGKLGALVIPGGGMDTPQRLAAIFDHEATVICSTPSYALHMAEVAEQKKLDLASSKVRVLIHAGEPGASIPPVRRRIEEVWGATVHDHAGATEIGAYGFSCAAQVGLHVNESEFIVEVLERGSDQPVPPGEPGELVVTNLGRWGFPVIRYRTGDMVRLAKEPCTCGRTYKLLQGGVIGRVDNMVIVRGINIFPSAIEAIIREIIPQNEFRLIFSRVKGLDELEIEVEVAQDELDKLETLMALFRQRLALRVPVRAVEPGAFPRFQLKARRILDRRTSLA
ncbi:MAG: AMP-binding protein [Chloroflexi bacterium]|nr:AMP-binding protein [Chloroflexota bacterium]